MVLKKFAKYNWLLKIQQNMRFHKMPLKDQLENFLEKYKAKLKAARDNPVPNIYEEKK